jgi:hypothetical protein
MTLKNKKTSMLLRLDPELYERMRIVAKINGRSTHEQTIRMIVNGCNHYIGKLKDGEYEVLEEQIITPKQEKELRDWFNSFKKLENNKDED